jgi:alpha-1,2-glucosyltransferase
MNWTFIQYLVSVMLAIWAFREVNAHVKEAYLDEVFHIPQTQRYCQGDFSYWDDKITTPPGLYLLAFGLQKLTSFIPWTNSDPCSVINLRAVNLGGVVLMVPLVITNIIPARTPRDMGILIGSFPLMAFFSNLFYTDVWSTIFVLAALNVGMRRMYILSAFLAFISLWFRQTNVVWAAFLTSLFLIDRNAGNFGFVDFLLAGVRSWDITIPYSLVALCFAVFIKLNGGITLGDKSNHQVGFNLPQVFYFALFLLFFSWPLWLSSRILKRYMTKCVGSPIRAVVYMGSLAAISLIIHEFTVVHPFILADNRHYTFYLWRRFIYPSWHPWAKFMLVPVYHFGVWILLTPGQDQMLLMTTYMGAVILTLAPSPLFEPRYYIIPYVMWRILLGGIRSSMRRKLEWMWYLVINAITLYVFIAKPFIWPSEPGQQQRFMW